MKLFFITIVGILLLSGCAQTQPETRTYEQQNSASEKALDQLDREMK